MKKIPQVFDLRLLQKSAHLVRDADSLFFDGLSSLIHFPVCLRIFGHEKDGGSSGGSADADGGKKTLYLHIDPLRR